ncbi:MAG: hypothetical protein JNK08_10235 [Sediminibacterium sp.]|nr:hypothetical protein [Sediminibacterium sp.]
MNRLLLFLLFGIISFRCLSQDPLTVGGRVYHSKDMQIFLKDDSLNAVWRTFYTTDQRPAFSYETLATKNELIYRKGFIEVDRQQNIIKNRELFYYDQLAASIRPITIN